jgi:hypothetical protein
MELTGRLGYVGHPYPERFLFTEELSFKPFPDHFNSFVDPLFLNLKLIRLVVGKPFHDLVDFGF